MIVGVPREIKIQEYRVALTPEGVTEFVKNGHTVLIEKNAGLGSSITDENCVQAGAKIIESVEKLWQEADLVIGAVLIPGARAPKLVTNQDVLKMKPGSVLVDIAIDQGGCFEDSKATTHENPTYSIHNSVFYCVANMPGAVPVTSTYALTNVTLPFAIQIANLGWEKALKQNPDLAKGLNTHAGKVTYKAVAEAHGYEFSPVL